MFGFKHPVVQYDALNPKCALIFHAVVDELSLRTGANPSTEFFKNPSVREQLDWQYLNGKRAIETQGDKVCCENIHMQMAMEVLSWNADDAGLPPSLFGMASTIPLVRSVVFGFAPGMAEAMKEEVYGITLRTCFVMSELLGKVEQTEIVDGSRQLWTAILDGCSELFGTA